MPPSVSYNPFSDPAGLGGRCTTPARASASSVGTATPARSPSLRMVGMAALAVTGAAGEHRRSADVQQAGPAASPFLPSIARPAGNTGSPPAPCMAGAVPNILQVAGQQVSQPGAESSYATFVAGSEYSTDTDWSDFDVQEFESMKVCAAVLPPTPRKSALLCPSQVVLQELEGAMHGRTVFPVTHCDRSSRTCTNVLQLACVLWCTCPAAEN